MRVGVYAGWYIIITSTIKYYSVYQLALAKEGSKKKSPPDRVTGDDWTANAPFFLSRLQKHSRSWFTKRSVSLLRLWPLGRWRLPREPHALGIRSWRRYVRCFRLRAFSLPVCLCDGRITPLSRPSVLPGRFQSRFMCNGHWRSTFTEEQESIGC